MATEHHEPAPISEDSANTCHEASICDEARRYAAEGLALLPALLDQDKAELSALLAQVRRLAEEARRGAVLAGGTPDEVPARDDALRPGGQCGDERNLTSGIAPQQEDFSALDSKNITAGIVDRRVTG